MTSQIPSPAAHHLQPVARRRFLGGIIGGLLGSFRPPPAPASARTRTDGPQVAPITINVGGLRMHAIQTGFVAVKRSHRELRGPAQMRYMTITADQTWTDWLPIWVWVIEHPEGVIVIDTGETARIAEPDYVNCDPVTAMIYRANLRFAVTPADQIGAQLITLGIDPLQVRWVVQTHLHSDHMGGLGSFDNAQIYVPQADYPRGTGVLACRFPVNFKPLFADFTDLRLPGLGQGFPLTRDGSVTIVPTYGHSDGHQSVLLKTDKNTCLFAGDTTFNNIQLQKGTIAGIVENVSAASATVRALQTFVRETRTIYLPTHDAQSGDRFANGSITTV